MNVTELDAVSGAGNFTSLSLSKLFQRQKWNALLTFSVGIALTMLYFATATRYFESEAKLFVKIGRQSVTLDPTATTGQAISVRETQNQEVFSVQELLASRTMAEKIVDRFGPDVILEGAPGDGSDESGFSLPSPGDLLQPLESVNLNPLRVYSVRDKAIKAFGQNLSVLAGKQTNILSIAYESEDPHHSQEVLQAFIEFGLEEHLRMHRIEGSQEFFVEQAELLRANLEELEKELSEIKSATGISSLETQRSIHLGMLGALRQEMITSESELQARRQELAERRKLSLQIPEMIILDQTTDQPQTVGQAVREKLYELEVQEEELASRYTDSHPKLVRVRRQIEEARGIAGDIDNRPSVKTGVNETYQAMEKAIIDLESQVVSLETRIDAVADDIVEAEQQLLGINQAEVAMRKLEREIELSTANYRTYSENLEQARINREIEAAKISSLIVMQYPSFVETPSNPKPSITLGLGLVLSTILAAGVAVRNEQKLQLADAQSRAQAIPEPHVFSRREYQAEDSEELVAETVGETS